MVVLMMKDGNCVQLNEGMSVEPRGNRLICYDTNGDVLRTFPRSTVSLFTSDPETAAMILREAGRDNAGA